jgi:hypothetical protein
MMLSKQYLPITQDSGLLQAIFELPHDEVLIPDITIAYTVFHTHQN